MPGSTPLEAWSHGRNPGELHARWHVADPHRERDTWSPEVARAVTALVDAAGLERYRPAVDVDERLRAATGLPEYWRSLVHWQLAGQELRVTACCD